MVNPFVDHTPESAPLASRPALEGAARKFGAIPTPLARLASSPAAVAAFHGGLAHFDESSLAPLEREVVTFVVATRNECHYCVALHSRLLGLMKAEPALVEALRAERALEVPRLEAIRRFTIAVLEARGAVADEDQRAFFAAGFTAENALDVVVGIGTYTLSTFANRLTRAPLDRFLEGNRWERSPR